MNYTKELMGAMIEGFLAEKTYRGSELVSNGLLRDVSGQLRAPTVTHRLEIINGHEIHEVKIKLKSVPVAYFGGDE